MKTLLNSLAIIVLAAFFSCNNPAKNTTSANHPTIQDNGVNIAYTDSGKGDTTLLFVHGWIINGSYWSNQVNYFSKKYRVVTVDLPGYGQSGKNRNTWAVKDFGRDVDSVMAQLNLKNVILVGHSMGGNIIVEAAVHAPDRVIALVGIDNFLGVGKPEDAKSKAAFADAIGQLKKNFKQVTTQYFNEDLFYKTTADSIKKRVLNDVAHADSTIAIASMEDNSFDEVANLKTTKKKLYLINSDIHETYLDGFKANGIPFELKEIHATGHFPMVEKPTEFNILLTGIIRDINKDK
jgi:pimeloyl-ACP methyl ester carboxylesterase